MRIIFLYEPDLNFNGPLDWLLQKWLKGLAESQVEIKVISDASTVERLSSLDSKIEWASSVKRWTWRSALSAFRAAVPFRPNLVHAVLGRPMKWDSPWAFLQTLSRLDFPVILSMGDRVTWPSSQFNSLPHITPSPEVAASLSANQEAKSGIFVPGPLSSHKNIDVTFSEIFANARKFPDQSYQIGFDWNEVPTTQRLYWRSQWLELPPQTRMNFIGTLSVSETLRRASQSSVVRSDLIANESWLRAILHPMTKESKDLAINTLLRNYNRLALAGRR